MAGIMNLPKGTGKRLGSSETPYSNKEALKNGISYITGTGHVKKYVRDVGSTKNEKARIIRLSDEALCTLRLIHKEASDVRDDALVVTTRTGNPQTATNLEHRAATIFKNAGLSGYTGGLHIFRRTFATRMYENGARVADIAAYIGDLESTTMQYYIAKRKKFIGSDGRQKQVVDFPKNYG